MEILGFNSPQEMQDYLRKMSKQAHVSMHPQQDRITYGDTWAQFHDVANRDVIFGRVATLDEVEAAEIEHGATSSEALQVVRSTEASLREGYMYAKAYDRYNPEGEYGTTHKAHVWPIDKELFYCARDVRWWIDQLPLAQKLNLEVAYREMRGHVRGNHRGGE